MKEAKQEASTDIGYPLAPCTFYRCSILAATGSSDLLGHAYFAYVVANNCHCYLTSSMSLCTPLNKIWIMQAQANSMKKGYVACGLEQIFPSVLLSQLVCK